MKYTQSHRILVVDDLADNLFLLKFTLELEGYRVELATSGEVALSIIETSPPDLVLLDVMMPDMSGFEVTQIMRQSQNLALIPIVLVTADRTVDLAQALAAGANDVIRKPIELDYLLSRVNTWCC